VAFQVFFPRALDGRLEGQDEHLAPPHLQGKLISGEGLAEPHLGVPKKMRRFACVFLLETLEIGDGLCRRFPSSAAIFNW